MVKVNQIRLRGLLKQGQRKIYFGFNMTLGVQILKTLRIVRQASSLLSKDRYHISKPIKVADAL